VEKERANPARDAWYTIECFYERALRFRPDDHVARLLYVNFLVKKKDTDNALKHLDYVAESTRDNPFAQFNAGMLYIDMKLYDKALAQAHRVIAMGFDRRELRDRLAAAGQWVEPPAEGASAPATGAASAAASGTSS
jgi:tetratricopeptide (TPR) repeat protein